MTPKEFIDENYFSLTIDCKREIEEIYQALEDYAKTKQLSLTDVSQQRKLLNALADDFNEGTDTYVIQKTIEKTLKAFNCG